jgi:hypothetical protein
MSSGHTKLGAGLVEDRAKGDDALDDRYLVGNGNASVAFHGIVLLLHDLQGTDQLGPSCELHPIFGKP